MKKSIKWYFTTSIFSSTFIFTLGFSFIGILVFVLAVLCGSLVSKPEDTAKSSSAHHVYWFNRLYDWHYVWDE